MPGPFFNWLRTRLVVGSCTSHPGVLGSIPKREEPGKTGAPCVKVPGSSRVPPPRSLVRDERTHPHRPRLVVYHSTCRPLSSSPPREQLCNRSCSNKHTQSQPYPYGFPYGIGWGGGGPLTSHMVKRANSFTVNFLCFLDKGG